MFIPRLIEKENEFLCKSQHQQPVKSVILDPFISNDHRLLCKVCEQENHQHQRIVDYQQLKICFNEQQREKIQQYQLIINPHIQCVENLRKILESLKSRLIQQLDNLICLSNDWITQLVDSATSYSFFEELDKLSSQQVPVLDLCTFIDRVKKTNQNLNSKINIKLDQFKLLPEFPSTQEIFSYQNNLIDQQNFEVKAQPLIYTNQSFYSMFQEIESDEIQQENVKAQKSLIWDDQFEKFVQITFQIEFTKDKKIQYTKDGLILRSESLKDTTEKPTEMTNLEQILYLKWVGNYGENNRKIGRWNATWIGQTLYKIGGQYSNDGKKEGGWIELFQNYWTRAQVYEYGGYFNNLRQGYWRYLYKGEVIDGGEYNNVGERSGNWRQLSDSFWDESQVAYSGEYKKGKKVGSWSILVRGSKDKKFKQIGGGSYDKEGQGIKTGYWIELNDEFRNAAQIVYSGEYKNGNKIGKWNIFYRRVSESKFKPIGGGSYDKRCQGIKIGKWGELSEEFRDVSQVIEVGEYKNGNKIGRWSIFYRGRPDNEFKRIGGGSYNNSGQGIKYGYWIELSDRFWYYSQITHMGEYYDGKKIGWWDICFNFGGQQKIGSGNKIEKWIELSDRFYNNSQVILRGSYKDGKKTGQWNILWRNWDEQKFSPIGGGSYDKEDCGLKVGKWVDLGYWYSRDSKVSYNGEYQKGKKVGNWMVMINFQKYSEIKYDK